MREIKFRAWDGKEMWIQGTPDIETLGSFFFHINASWPLMQFTGLKDKNGKEIYEGDIIDMGDKLEVRHGFNNGEHEGFYLRRNDGYEYTMHAFTSPLEVIGNKWESPELLTPPTTE